MPPKKDDKKGGKFLSREINPQHYIRNVKMPNKSIFY